VRSLRYISAATLHWGWQRGGKWDKVCQKFYGQHGSLLALCRRHCRWATW